MKAGNHFIGKHDALKLPDKYVDPNTFKIGGIDNYGNFFLELHDHHVYLEEKSFFSKIIFSDKHKIEKDSRIEAFSKFC